MSSIPLMPITQPSALEAFVKGAGLEDLARRLEGDTFVVCDLTRHGVQGCADMRSAIEQQQILADIVAIGVCLFIAVLVGSIAVAFVNLAGRAARPLYRRRQRRRALQAANDDTAIMGAAA